MSVSGNYMRQLHEGVEFEDQMNVGKKIGERETERQRGEQLSNPWKCKARAEKFGLIGVRRGLSLSE